MLRSPTRNAWFLGLFGLFLAGAAGDGVRPAHAQIRAAKAAPPAPRWTVLFRSDDPSIWDTDTNKKDRYAIPLSKAPAKVQYLRLVRTDTGGTLIIPLTRDQLQQGKVPKNDTGSWWHGTSKKDWEGHHLGIATGPRYKFPAPQGIVCVAMEGWDAFQGSGFGHKAFVNDKQYYCWKSKEIPKTVFEIAVTDGPLTAGEKQYLLTQP